MANSNMDNTNELDDMDLADPYDTALDDDNWDGGTDDADLAPPKKKKGNLFTVVLIALGVVAFVGIMYVNGGKGGGASPAPTTVVAVDPALPPMDQVAVDAPTTDTAFPPMPGLGDTPQVPDAMIESPSVPGPEPLPVEPMEAVIEPPPPVAMSADDPAPVIGVDTDGPLMIDTDVPPTLAADGAIDDAGSAMVDPVASDMAPANDIGLDLAVPAPTVDASDTSESAVTPAKLQDLEQRLDQLAQTAAAAPGPDAGAVQKDLAALRSDIQGLAARLAALESTPKPTPPVPDVAAPAPVVKDSVPQEMVQSEPVQAPAPKAAPVSRPTYILRAVSGGRAYVSTTLTSTLKTVAVGDMLDGWGRVTDITKGRNGKWAVVTTGGTVRQK